MKLLWDFDGTLFDTYPAYVETVLRLFPQLAQQFSYDDILREMKVSFSHGFRYLGLTAEQEAYYRRENLALPPELLRPFDGVERVLAQAELNVIMSHKEHAVIDAVLKAHGLTQYFTEIVTPEDGFPRKPDAASYRYLHDKYALDAAIGDRALDLIPAKAVGMKTIMFQGTCEAADASLDQYEHFEKVWKMI